MRAMRFARVWLLAGMLAACGPKQPAPGGETTETLGKVQHDQDTASEDVRFAKEADALYWFMMDHDPVHAAALGYHQFDGTLPDPSPSARAQYVDALTRFRDALEGFHPSKLSKIHQVEREVLLAEISEQLFYLVALRMPQRNPMTYLWALDFEGYVSRDYAPLSHRAKGLAGVCVAAGPYLAQAQANLEQALPRTWIQTALMQARGLIDFIKADVPEAMAKLEGQAKTELDAALAQCVTALTTYEKFLDGRMDSATDDFALGPDFFLQMLRDTEGLDIDLATLEAIGKADLERNLAALETAARKIAPSAPIATIVAGVVAKKPALDAVIPTAEQQAVQMRQFLIDEQIVSIPSDDIAEIRETPPFMRFNFAFLSSPGPFEKVLLPAFYYITPPDPTWSKKVQREYVPSRYDLLFTTIHEVWPGHFLHYLHKKQLDSKILNSFCSYAMSEGWAHYTEEMMWDAGVGDGDPRVHIGQLVNALLRNVRFVSAIGLHTRGMTVDESMAMFREQAFYDQGTAQQQAVRGTFDPGYLNYTLGKLMIRKLHDDWKAKMGDGYSLKGFHDEFLSYSCAPIPVTRRFMLGDDAGPPL